MQIHDDPSLIFSVGEALPRDLGDGLTLRQVTPADARGLADFNAQVHRDRGVEEPNGGQGYNLSSMRTSRSSTRAASLRRRILTVTRPSGVNG